MRGPFDVGQPRIETKQSAQHPRHRADTSPSLRRHRRAQHRRHGRRQGTRSVRLAQADQRVLTPARRRPLLRQRNDVVPCFAHNFLAVTQKRTHFNRFFLVLGSHLNHHAPAAGGIVAMDDEIGALTVADSNVCLQRRVDRQLAQRRPIEVDREFYAVVA